MCWFILCMPTTWTLWCLILSVYLTGPQDAQSWLNTISVCVCEGVPVRLAFESMSWVNHMARPTVGGGAGGNLLRDWIEQKDISEWERIHPTLLPSNSDTVFSFLWAWTKISTFPGFQACLFSNYGCSPGSQVFRLRLEPHHQLLWVPSSPVHSADLGIVQPP